jgi:zinc protease
MNPFRLLAVYGALAALALADVQKPPPPGVPREVKLVEPVEKTLGNGLRVVVIERPGVPLLSVRLMIESGAEMDPPELAGLGSMTAALLTRGTAKRSATQIAEDIEALGGAIDAETGWDATSVKLGVLSNQAPAALEIFADVVRAPAFAAEEVKRLRRETLDDLRVILEEPRTVALAAAQRAALGSTSYAHPRVGTLGSVARIQRDTVAKLHAVHYRPANAILIFAGNLTAADGFGWAERFFGDWKNPADPLPERRTGEMPQHPRVVAIDLPNAGQAAVVLAKLGIARDSKDFISGLVANGVLGNGYTSRLNLEIRIKRGLSYGAKSNLLALAQPGPFVAQAQTKNSAAVEVAQLMRQELDRLGADPVAPVELTPRVSTLTGDFSRELETNEGFAKAVGELAVHRRPLAELNAFARDARAVQPEAIQEFARTHLQSAEMSLVIAGRLESFRAALDREFKDAEIIAQKELDLDSPTLRTAKSAR